MNPIQLASILLLLLALHSKANALNNPSGDVSSTFAKRISYQFHLEPSEAERVKNRTVRFYFTVDSSGKVEQVVAVESDPQIKKMLEMHFRKLNLKGYPANSGARVDLNFILN